MTVLILNRLGPDKKYMTNFLEWLSEYPEPVYMFTDSNFSDQFTGYSLVKGFRNYDSNGLVEVEAVKLGKEHSISRVIALDERDLLRAARIREALDIPGQSVESARAFRHKPTMKSYIKKAGLPCPDYMEVYSPMDLYKFILKNGFPIVVKPQDGFGSINTKVIWNWEQAEEFMESTALVNMMVETFVDGEMYHSNGLIMDGEIVFLAVGRYGTVPLNRVAGGGYQQVLGALTELLSPDEEIFSRIYEFTNNIVKSLPAPNHSSFHCEMFHTANDQLVFCEIASRTAGARIGECIIQSYGVDLNAEWSRLECGLDVTVPRNIVPKQLSASYLIPTRRGKLISMIDSFPFSWVTEYQPRVKEGEELRESKSSTGTIGSVVFVGSSREELRKRFHEICKVIDKSIFLEDIP
ncbi:hypothetical protein CN568_24185 [Bacillus pseudomycoides]|uniref:ATP-grasp domain-containing protein n=1 Tax=Bacillus TaxID=1386 RepID=UPI00037E852C|nr:MULTISPECIES: ATP-grasp domain-containing protein [Bacillus]MCX2829472.1 ATP-grasp domain-containing protein [Bacillus sp. DHT2]MDR4916745.1 ATP-grasp domain-containing protein [Bacillus pseudomycoides]PEK39646.1 hypothetical protein CN691_02620 [Bacillus pseudomycoides]PEK66391.1 hypothetical protein CN593_18135 [Bacillus pseudomycoides]PEP38739.1 hypothetical protein CN568_24185 [Bacillus pseudomycoides]